jgi:hypothetical protein
MDPSDGRGFPPHPDEDVRAFQAMVASLVKYVENHPTQFSKKLEECPRLSSLPPQQEKNP